MLVIDDGRRYYQPLGGIDIIRSDSTIIIVLKRKHLTIREKRHDVVVRKPNAQLKV